MTEAFQKQIEQEAVVLFCCLQLQGAFRRGRCRVAPGLRLDGAQEQRVKQSQQRRDAEDPAGHLKAMEHILSLGDGLRLHLRTAAGSGGTGLPGAAAPPIHPESHIGADGDGCNEQDQDKFNKSDPHRQKIL